MVAVLEPHALDRPVYWHIGRDETVQIVDMLRNLNVLESGE